MDKLVICAALVGAELSRNEQPNLPLTPVEIAEAAAEAQAAGAAVVHLHVRDDHGNATQDVEVFRTVISEIRKRTDVICQISTGGAVGAPTEKRLAPLDIRPEMATLTTGTVNFGNGVFMNEPSVIEAFASRMKELGVKPEIECFDAGHIANALRLAKKGLIPEPLYFDFVMGVPGGIPGTVRDLLHCIESLPASARWQVAGIGRAELTLAAVAIAMGGNVRVGFEDNIYYSRGVLAKSNAELVARVARIAGELGREIATPNEARVQLGITANRG
ncbi:MAG: 3-keto-5-aminohexanoate cleavage protein [Clostridia bacterium]|nr:3-keto-5-aminohexanoate cleavage protein [Clostridia bacterium]